MTSLTYSLPQLFAELETNVRRLTVGRPVQVGLRIDSQLPQRVVGDAAHLSIVLRKLADAAMARITSGMMIVSIEVDGSDVYWELIANDDGRGEMPQPNSTGCERDRALARIVERLDGRLTVRRDGARSLRYTLVTPLTEVAPATPEPISALLTDEILVLADVPQNIRFVRYILEKLGLRIQAASSIEAAVRLTEIRLQDDCAPRMIVIDLPLVGVVVDPVAALRDVGYSGPIAVLSASGPHPEADVTIAKPFHRAKLLAALRQWLNIPHEPSRGSRPHTWQAQTDMHDPV